MSPYAVLRAYWRDLGERVMKAGDPVIYSTDPLLFGEMEVIAVKGKIVFVIVDPDSKEPSYERFLKCEVSHVK